MLYRNYHDTPYYDYHHRSYYDDWLIYELMSDRDRYRREHLDRLYKVDPCNPAYGNSLCRTRWQIT